jgi:nucleotide-binding universal stress UspA family protein
MFNRILVTTDGSPLANRALPYAAELARTHTSALTVLYVVPEPPVLTSVLEGKVHTRDVRWEREQRLAEGSRILEEAAAELAFPGAALIRRESYGHPIAVVIADEVALDGADLVVMSSHGRSGVKHLLLGSVAEQVMQRLSVPVFLVRGTATLLLGAAPEASATTA